MIFSSIPFIFIIFPLFLFLDRALGRLPLCRNLSLLAVSCLFYLWGEGAWLGLLLGMGLFSWLAGLALARLSAFRIAFLTLAITALLAVLCQHKYGGWIVELLNPGGLAEPAAIPLGISFFTFMAISYLVDISRGQTGTAPLPGFMAWFCMFPHLVAGPIVRWRDLAGDIAARGPSRQLFAFGFYRFILGMNKKILIANSAAPLADAAFSMGAAGILSTPDAWLGILAFGIQIYFDFSGYSDMAIGLAAMAGFHFEENFNRPYSSASISEFWRRWHISLSKWLKDYIYIPLGGNRKGAARGYFNVIFVFAICGIWHGAGWTFLAWGLWQAFFIVLERAGLAAILARAPGALSRSYAMLAALCGWAFFRAESLDGAAAYLALMFAPAGSPALWQSQPGSAAMVLAAALCCALPDRLFSVPTARKPADFSLCAFCLQLLGAILSFALLFSGARNPFIYFNF